MKNLSNGVNLSHYAFSESERNLQDDSIFESMTPFYADGSNLTITFLNLNRTQLSVRLLDSIRIYLSAFKGQILIFDNGSDAEELEKLKAFISETTLPVKLVESNTNRGVAGGRNQAAELIETDWFLSLDNDVYFIADPLDAIKECIDKLGANFLNLPLLSPDGQTIFAAGGNLSLEKYRDSYAIGCPTTFRQTLKSEISPEHPYLSTCLYGTAMVAKTKTFLAQGGFDANMFIGFEDIDFSLRLYKAGMKIGNVNKFCAVHGHEAPQNASDADYEKTRFSREILHASAEYFHSKHNLYAWTESINEWVAKREQELSLDDPEKTNFSGQAETGRREKTVRLNRELKKAGDLPRIALIVDLEGWAHDICARQICRELGGEFDFQIFSAASYKNTAYLMQEVLDFDLIHFFWRGNLFSLLSDQTRGHFLEKGWDYEEFITNTIAKANITTSVYDHLFLSEPEIEERKILFNALSIGYTVSSRRLERIYASLEGFPKPDGVLSEGVDLKTFYPVNPERPARTDGEIVIGWAGNSKWGGDGIDHKGITTIIKPAVESLKAEGYRVRGYYADRQERWIPHSEMNDYYNSIDIYVCASENYEGAPVPVLESMACGLPVVSTDVGVVPEVFGRLQKNYILASRSVEQLKSKLIELITDREKRVALSRENLESIRQWSDDKQSRKWESFFRSMISDSKNTRLKERRDGLRSQSLKMHLNQNRLSGELKDLQSAFDNSQTWIGELQNRVAELDEWTAELQTVLKNAENRVGELDKWTAELQAALRESENLAAELNNRNEILETGKRELRRDLEIARASIESMQASRFWKLREQWFKVKNALPGKGKEE